MKMINVKVSTADAELEFAVANSTTGKQLFDQIVKTIGLRESWYFGLEYTDTTNFTTWVKSEKKLTKQSVKPDNNGVLCFRFRAKFYPEKIDEIIQDFTLRLFYFQVKELIFTNDLFCPADFAVLLASYIMQVKYGDYNSDKHKIGSLPIERILPQSIIAQFKLDSEDWKKRILECWGDYKGYSREQAMLEFLRVAQNLDQYGMNYFAIRNKKGTELYFGVDAVGMNIYEKNDKLNPKIGFPYSEIKNISYSGKKFIIKPSDPKANDFVFFVSRTRINEKILGLCIGNHELYARRRKPDTLDVQQMRQKTVEERKQRALDSDRLKHEKLAREVAEEKQKEIEENLKSMQEEMERKNREIAKAHDLIYRLEQQLQELHNAKATLEHKESELLELNEQLQSMSEDERKRLTEEIAKRESQIIEMRSEIEKKQERVDKSRSALPSVHTHYGILGLREADNKSLASASDNEEITHAFAELSVDDDAFVTANQPELERALNADANLGMKNRLDKLHRELDLDNANMSGDHKIHLKNRQQNRDRYKTLTLIRDGNTQRRVEQFEGM